MRENATKLERMSAWDALLLAGGGCIWAKMPEGEHYQRVRVRVEVGYSNDEDRVTFDAGWGTCTLRAEELVSVDTGRIA